MTVSRIWLGWQAQSPYYFVLFLFNKAHPGSQDEYDNLAMC